MRTLDKSHKNLWLYATREAFYVSVTPMLWGSITQQFLLSRGVSPSMVGYYATLVTAVQLIATMVLSRVGDRVRSALKFCTVVSLLHAVLAAVFLPVVAWDVGIMLTFGAMCIRGVILLCLYVSRSICSYKIHYEIVDKEHYGSMVFLTSAMAGLVGIGFTTLFSITIDRNTAGNPYLVCTLLTMGCIGLSTLCNRKLRSIYPVPTVTAKPVGLLRQMKTLLGDRSFRNLLIPNTLRGITISITDCIVLIALVMGIDESGRAKLPLVCALASTCASGLYMLLSRKLPVGIINIIGGMLTCGLVLLPRGNTLLFLTVFFVAYLGRMLVDNAIPTMIFPIVPSETAGFYHAWRTVLYYASSIITLPIASALIEIIDPLWLTVPAALTYVVVTVWYYLACHRLQKQ